MGIFRGMPIGETIDLSADWPAPFGSRRLGSSRSSGQAAHERWTPVDAEARSSIARLRFLGTLPPATAGEFLLPASAEKPWRALQRSSQGSFRGRRRGRDRRSYRAAPASPHLRNHHVARRCQSPRFDETARPSHRQHRDHPARPAARVPPGSPELAPSRCGAHRSFWWGSTGKNCASGTSQKE
jgi:hypothetical protein